MDWRDIVIIILIIVLIIIIVDWLAIWDIIPGIGEDLPDNVNDLLDTWRK